MGGAGYRVVPIDEAGADAVAGWCYPPPYDVYNMLPSDAGALLDPDNHYRAVLAGNELIGFCCFGRDARVPAGKSAGWYGPDGVDVGLGLRPDLTGQGLGADFLATVLDAVRAEVAERGVDGAGPPARLRLTVAAFNARARRLYHRAGFTERAHAGGFVLMDRPIAGGPARGVR